MYTKDQNHNENIIHSYFEQTKNIVLNENLSLQTEEEQKKYIKNKIMSDPFRANPTSCHIEMMSKSKGQLESILLMEKLMKFLIMQRIRYFFLESLSKILDILRLKLEICFAKSSF